jgi:hypothetical protein
MMAYLLALLVFGYVKPQSCTSNIDALKNGNRNGPPPIGEDLYLDSVFSFDNATAFTDKSLPKQVCGWQQLSNLTNSSVFGSDNVVQPK